MFCGKVNKTNHVHMLGVVAQGTIAFLHPLMAKAMTLVWFAGGWRQCCWNGFFGGNPFFQARSL